MKVTRRDFVKLMGAGAISSGLTDSGAAQTRGRAEKFDKPLLAPDPPPFPYYIDNDRNAVIREAARISNELERYVRDWFDGRVPAEISDRLIPSGNDRTVLKNFRLYRAEDVRAEDQWAQRRAAEIDLNALLGQFPDPHCTYLFIPYFFAPFGAQLVIEGEFPHCRFFDIQVTPSFEPETYRYGGWAGAPEVSLVDADIEPRPGHTNPFRVGANRLSKRRSYRVNFDLAVGNAVELNGRAFQPPFYRAPGNRRVGGAIQYQGPWGDPRFKPWGHGRGLWDLGQIWIRYYAPDKPFGALGGVPLPKVHYELSNGRRFFINCDWSEWYRRVNFRKSVNDIRTFPTDPPANSAGIGWNVQTGIFRGVYAGLGGIIGAGPAYIRALDRGVTGRGEAEPPPNNYEPSATTCTYINYLTRSMNLGLFKIIVLTGKLPTTPKTRNGEARMRAAEARYWSLTSYSLNLPIGEEGWGGGAITSIMDDELVTDEQGRYIIVYSWNDPLYRPANANPENGVTWRDWSVHTTQNFNLRWLSVQPEWSFARTPDESKLGWKANSISLSFDRILIGNNNHNGFLGEYLPRIAYLTKGEFEALGSGRIDPARIPVWR